MQKAALIFPHQLYNQHSSISDKTPVYLIEDQLYFGNDDKYPCNMHAQKLVLHRASMKAYEKRLKNTYSVHYIEAKNANLKKLFQKLKKNRVTEIVTYDPTDHVLLVRLKTQARILHMKLTLLPSQNFLNTHEDNHSFFQKDKKPFMKTFYQYQRKRLGILMNANGTPKEGKWSFDSENRKKLPKKMVSSLPNLLKEHKSEEIKEAKKYITKHFPHATGSVETFPYPITHIQAKNWLKKFLKERITHFGPYEDALVPNESWIFHSVLTPALNIGLLSPQQIINETLEYTAKHKTPIASTEGFLRQIIGWREFIRASYISYGTHMRNANHWGHQRKLPPSFYQGTTGIKPVDNTIKRVLKTGYCHHIERLMVLGNIFFLSEIDPKELYRWFTECFVDSYDWVMVPNVYAMSQNSAGGLITTKPYFSGSNYILKMSHYSKGSWCDTWDGLYWYFIQKHAKKLSKNPRWNMMTSLIKKMDNQKLKTHLKHAKQYFSNL
ncbi:MAG: cryptochrome/photolyase family protein [Candidatus Gracilibacteria bacterium]|nr:cryptochrome/photolyase family protein [Candidatus Gracilibacteria bacterium]